jgi:hypothetical protein
VNADDSVDLRHVRYIAFMADSKLNIRGHNLLGRITNAYIDSVLCEMEDYPLSADAHDLDTVFPLEPLPRVCL